MKIALRGGHSSNLIGAVGIVNEYEEMQKYYKYVSDLLTSYGHTVIDCNSHATTQGGELSEGARKSNNGGAELFISLHMNAFNGAAHGTECVISSESSGSFKYAKKICSNFESLGFKNRGVKCEPNFFEMKNVAAPNIIFEICFCDSKVDIDTYNKYSWVQLAHALCNAIDERIPLNPVNNTKRGYVVTKYLKPSYEGYNGVKVKSHLDMFGDATVYVLGDNNGVWLETSYLPLDKCHELKNKLGDIFHSIKE